MLSCIVLSCLVLSYSKGSLVANYSIMVVDVPAQTPASMIIQAIATEVYEKISSNSTELQVDFTQNDAVFDGDITFVNSARSSANFRSSVTFLTHFHKDF